jgi:hypothetical protein
MVIGLICLIRANIVFQFGSTIVLQEYDYIVT